MTDKLRQAAQQILEAAADLTILTPREWQAVHGLKIDALRDELAEPDRMTPKELAERLKRGEKWQLAEQPAESLDGKLVMGLAVIRELTGTQKTDNIEATIEAVRKAVAPQPAKREPPTDEHPLTVFAKECALGAYKETELRAAAKRALKAAIERAHGIGEQV